MPPEVPDDDYLPRAELTPLTRHHIAALFPESNRELVATRLRDDAMADDSSQAHERIWFAILKLSEGDLRKLDSAIRLARTDWRDLLVAAEFAHDTQAHAHWQPGV